MNVARRMRLMVFCAALFPVSAIPAEVVVNTTGGRNYHHTELGLERGMLLPGSGDLSYTFSEGGMFEIHLEPEVLGFAHPGCSALTVRMPWTNGSTDGADRKIARKRELFHQIEAVRVGTAGNVRVVLELDPYFETTDGSSRLTECTVFFRQAFGAYVDHAGPLAQ